MINTIQILFGMHTGHMDQSIIQTQFGTHMEPMVQNTILTVRGMHIQVTLLLLLTRKVISMVTLP